ncbi:hypothetical protein Q9X98_004746 [Vibrio parahaemolyticus]|nr:hypothetical protein [Vibrio parahaemolyticus]
MADSDLRLVLGTTFGFSNVWEQQNEAAEQAANNALTVANQATADLDKLITDMNDAFVYHAGVISAQGDK